MDGLSKFEAKGFVSGREYYKAYSDDAAYVFKYFISKKINKFELEIVIKSEKDIDDLIKYIELIRPCISHKKEDEK